MMSIENHFRSVLEFPYRKKLFTIYSMNQLLEGISGLAFLYLWRFCDGGTQVRQEREALRHL